jgi:hypothetical protein
MKNFKIILLSVMTIVALQSCSTNESGSVGITVSRTSSYYSCSSIQIGLGYTSTDCVNGAFFAQKSGSLSGSSYSFILEKDDLAPGVYYYKVTCGTTTVKNGAFTIKANQTTKISISVP